jgi:hypothetical protein
MVVMATVMAMAMVMAMVMVMVVAMAMDMSDLSQHAAVWECALPCASYHSRGPRSSQRASKGMEGCGCNGK